jgi:hypothetical protein
VNSLVNLFRQLVVLDFRVGVKRDEVGNENIDRDDHVSLVAEARQLRCIEVNCIKIVAQLQIQESSV